MHPLCCMSAPFLLLQSPSRFPNRPSRGLHPRAPLRGDRHPSCAACPGARSAALHCAASRSGGLPRQAGGTASATGEHRPPAGRRGRGGKAEMPFGWPSPSTQDQVVAVIGQFHSSVDDGGAGARREQFEIPVFSIQASALHQFDTDPVRRCDITQQSPPTPSFNATGKRTPLARSSSQKARRSP